MPLSLEVLPAVTTELAFGQGYLSIATRAFELRRQSKRFHFTASHLDVTCTQVVASIAKFSGSFLFSATRQSGLDLVTCTQV